TVDGLVNAELAACPAEAFYAEEAIAARLALVQPGVAALIPNVIRVARGRVRGFAPAASAFVGKLNARYGAQAVGDR
ncbi:MAG: hypothetical protein P8Y27_17945, partial [Chromatiaceae bacterium]